MKKAVRRFSAAKIGLMVCFFAVVWGCAGLNVADKPSAVREVYPGLLAGYLGSKGAPDSMLLLTPPPAPGSAALAEDEDIFKNNQQLIDSPRWTLAAEDANISFPHAANIFSCALDLTISQEEMPYLYQLLHRVMTDAIVATLKAKNHYKRIRPFMEHNVPICSPSWEKQLRKDGSYPSGHSAIGWTWAFILSELAPERGDILLARGIAFENSRVVCNVHWHSDVIAGRFMGAAVVSRLHSNADFIADMKKAKAEIAAARAKGVKPASRCTWERDVLSGKPAQASK